MILYLDTSALVKLFVQEAHSAQVRGAVSRSTAVVTHLIAYTEACSAFARLAAERADTGLAGRLRRALDMYWPEWQAVTVDELLVRRAADLAVRHRLRGYDSVHLAAAEAVYRAAGEPAGFVFAAFDASLGRAATAEGLALLEA